jgi:hypothetical protein
MAEDYSQVVGTVPDTKAYTKTRRDERFVLTEQKNIELDSQESYVVLDSMEAGSLSSIKITLDNPYAQVLLQIDEYRNKDPDGQCAAEIIYNGNSDNTNRNFKVLDGQSSSKGYTLEYKPDQPEEYNKRIRIIIKNSIKASTSVYGMALNYTSGGSLPTPAVPSHMAGGTFSHPAFKALSLSQIARAMTKPVGVGGYASNNVFNESAIMNDDIELGSDHPFEGIAGTPTFKRDVSSDAIMEAGTIIQSGNSNPNTVSLNGTSHYRLRVLDEPEQFPGSSSSPSQMVVEIAPVITQLSFITPSPYVQGFNVVPWYGLETIRKSDLMAAGPFGDTWPGTSTYTPFTGTGDDAGATDGKDDKEKSLSGATLPAAESIIGKRMFIRRGGTIYFPGVVKTVTKHIATNANTTTASEGMASAISQTNGIGRFLDNNADNKFGTVDTLFAVGAHNQTTGNDIIVMPAFTGNENTLLDGVKIAEGTANVVTLDSTKVVKIGNTNSNDTINSLPTGHGFTTGMSLKGEGLGANTIVDSHTTNSITISLNATATATGVTLTGFNDMLLRPRNADDDGGSGAFTGTYEVFNVPHTPWVYTFTFEPGVTESPIDFGVLYDNENDNPYLGGVAFTGAEQTMNLSKGKFASTTGDSTTGTGPTNSRGLYPASESNCWGTVTSQADTNPKVLIKSIEVKRNKRVSYSG